MKDSAALSRLWRVHGGRAIGPYEVGERLGGRGIAEVFAARRMSRSSGAALAIKVLRSEYEGRPEAVRTFRMKQRICSVMEHPNLPRVFEFGDSEGLPFIAMELLDGVKLGEVLERRINFHPVLAAEIARCIAEALHHLHTLSEGDEVLDVVHLEVSPDNVFLCRDGRVKLLDVGVNASAAHLGASFLVSNVAHLAPEQARTETRIDYGSDVYSVGRLLAAMLEGTQVERSLRDVVVKAMASQRPQRYQTARELADALGVHLLTQLGFNAEVSIRSIVSTYDQRASLPVPPPRPFSEVDDSFGADTRVRTMDLRPRKQGLLIPVLLGGVAVLVLAIFAVLIALLLKR